MYDLSVDTRMNNQIDFFRFYQAFTATFRGYRKRILVRTDMKKV